MSILALLDDQDPTHISYTGNWLNGSSSSYFNGTASGGRQLGNTATVKFIGTTLALYGTNSPGSASCKVSVDGGSQTSQFEVNRDHWQDHTLFWQSEILSDDEHEVVFTIAEDVDNPVLYFDYFTYTVSSKTPMENVTLYVDSQDSQVQYSGNWTEHPTNHYMFSGTSRKSESEGDSFTYEFEGVGVSFYGQIDHDQTTFTKPIVSLDGQVQDFSLPTREDADIDPNDPWWNSKYFSVDSLESKKHTLVVSAGNNRPVWLDYILVQPGTPANSTSGISSGAIAGAVIGAVAGLALIIGGIALWWRRRQRARVQDQDDYVYHADISEIAAIGPSLEAYVQPFSEFRSPAQSVGERETRKGSELNHSTSSAVTRSPVAAESTTSGNRISDAMRERQSTALDLTGQPYEDSGYRFTPNTAVTRPPPFYTPE